MEYDTVVLHRSEAGDWQGLDRVVERAVEHLSQGGLLAHPTTSVYGFGGRRETDVEKSLTRLKDREHGKGFVYLVSDIAAARAEFPDARWSCLAECFAERFWPGALTLVLDDAAAGVALRAEAHPVTRAVLQRWSRAISSTSLNPGGEPAAATGGHARRVLRDLPTTDRTVLYLDVGRLPGPPPSTLVRVTGDRYEILRHGAIGADAIEAAAG